MMTRVREMGERRKKVSGVCAWGSTTLTFCCSGGDSQMGLVYSRDLLRSATRTTGSFRVETISFCWASVLLGFVMFVLAIVQ